MPKKITPSKKAVSTWIIHFVIFAVGVFLMWFFTYHGTEGFVYPWPIWVSCAWLLAIIAHGCLVWANYEDKGYKAFSEQK